MQLFEYFASVLRRSRSCRVDTHGVAAVEFALISPVMTVCLLGTIELTNMARMQAKVHVAAGQLAELVAGQPSIIIGNAATGPAVAGSLNDLCTGASYNILPYNPGAMQASIGSVTVGFTLGFLHPITDWTTDVSCGTTSYHAGQTALFMLSDTPRSFFTIDGTPYTSGGTPVMGYSAIEVQIRYTYKNVLPRLFGQSVLLTATAVARPRSNSTVTCTTTSPPSTTPITCPQNP